MSDWSWVTLAYVVVYGTLAAYGGSVVVRSRRVRRSLEGR